MKLIDRNITNIDISHIVIKQMQDINNAKRPDLVFEHMDATQMTYPDEKFDIVLDKGTLDALMPDNEQAAVLKQLRTVEKYFEEIKRVLRHGGKYMCVSLLQEHILKELLSYFPTSGFMFNISRCHQVEAKARMEEGISYPVFMVIATKATQLPKDLILLELALTDDTPERVSSTNDMMSAILCAQQSAMICSSLRNKNTTKVGEIIFDLYRPKEKLPRYTVCVLEQPRIRKAKTYAAFIVPQGREMDWLFCTKEGRLQVLDNTGRERLAIFILNREHKFESLDAVQAELAECVRNLAPAGLCGVSDIPYLSLGPDIAVRSVCYEGDSIMSGPFVVEDIKKDGHKFRRLVFLSNPYVIQSEMRFMKSKNVHKKGKKLDFGFLACEHHVYMSAGVNTVIDINEPDEIMIIGLGGGGLCSFLHHCFPKLKITAVEIDDAMLEVATKYFNLILDDRMKVEIADGIEFIRYSIRCKKKYKAILFDIDNKDTTVGMSCPPREFLDSTQLEAVANLLTEDGIFILNLVSRDLDLKNKAKRALRLAFQSITCYAIQGEVNEIIMCSLEKKDKKEWGDILKLAVANLNKQAAARKLSSFEEAFDVSALLESLSKEF
ncbi:PREDICTED: methyltransferase-like protein 13 isoform X2 [Dinoponera quadriceps]|uniref:Methyltransferase-like protein 13 isoform X2 n=1 Tax=Dinoponera quadriceps TaxID=609295 RepID=A0A6P3X2H2_DINQU|nr:PREDICTED: methyltransferase-like protein 13 isoform X2 [Dinoponera quadriceps]